jgi:hypothetical protein
MVDFSNSIHFSEYCFGILYIRILEKLSKRIWLSWYSLCFHRLDDQPNQFKKITGESPSEYKHKGSFIRKPLEDIVRTYPMT